MSEKIQLEQEKIRCRKCGKMVWNYWWDDGAVCEACMEEASDE